MIIFTHIDFRFRCDQKGRLLDLSKGSSITTQTNQTYMYMYMQTTIIIPTGHARHPRVTNI